MRFSVMSLSGTDIAAEIAATAGDVSRDGRGARGWGGSGGSGREGGGEGR